MTNPAQEYTDILQDRLKAQAEFFRITNEDESPDLWILYFRDTPAPGHTTAFTWGVSDVIHPSWTTGRPELTLTLETNEADWALALGHMAKHQRGEIPFATGTVLEFENPMASDTQMTGFFLHEPITFKDTSKHRIALSDRSIHLMGAFPLHPNEINRISVFGLESFFTGGDWDPYSVSRPSRFEAS